MSQQPNVTPSFVPSQVLRRARKKTLQLPYGHIGTFKVKAPVVGDTKSHESLGLTHRPPQLVHFAPGIINHCAAPISTSPISAP